MVVQVTVQHSRPRTRGRARVRRGANAQLRALVLGGVVQMHKRRVLRAVHGNGGMRLVVPCMWQRVMPRMRVAMGAVSMRVATMLQRARGHGAMMVVVQTHNGNGEHMHNSCGARAQ